MRKIIELRYWWLWPLIAGLFCTSSTTSAENTVAKVNGIAITAMELEVAIDRLIPRATYHGNVTPEKRAEYREPALQELISQELQFQDGKARGISPDKKIVKEGMERIRDRFKSEKEFKKALEKSGVTEDQLRVQLERQAVIQATIAKTVIEPSLVKDEVLKDYYIKNTAKFVQPESVSLRIITSKSQEKAGEALEKITKGNDFGDIAARYSEDNFRVKGGDIGYVHRGRVLPEIEEAAFKMKKGETSGIIKAEGMFFIIKVDDKKQAQQMSFDDVKDKLKKDLEKKRSEELMDTWMAGLRAEAKIEIFGQDADGQTGTKQK